MSTSHYSFAEHISLVLVSNDVAAAYISSTPFLNIVLNL